jgi:hypothetical protein
MLGTVKESLDAARSQDLLDQDYALFQGYPASFRP